MYTKLREMRKKKKFTVKVMAEKLEISKPFYSQLENGTRKLSYPMAVKIAAIFHVRPDSIFYEDYLKTEEK